MASWGLYGDLPPPSTGGSTSATPSPNPNNGTNSAQLERTPDPKLAKMMPTAVRKKAVLMVPRSTHVQQPRSKVQKTAHTELKPIIDKTPTLDNKDALSMVSSAYPIDASHPLEVEEEYDPARPNEYDRYVAERKRNNNSNHDDDNYNDDNEGQREEERLRERERERPREDIHKPRYDGVNAPKLSRVVSTFLSKNKGAFAVFVVPTVRKNAKQFVDVMDTTDFTKEISLVRYPNEDETSKQFYFCKYEV